MRIWTYDFLWAVFQGTLRGVSLVRLSCSHNLHQRIKRSWGWAFSLNVGCCSVAQLYSALCSPMDCSTPACPVLHYHPEIAQTHVHWVCDAIQTSHPLPAFSSCLQSFPASGSSPMNWLFASGGQSIGVSASVLPMNTQGWFPLGWTGLTSSLSKGLSRFFSSPQFKSISSSVLSFLYSPTLTSTHDYWKNHSFDYMDLCCQRDVSVFKYAIYICHRFSSKEQAS